MEETLIKRIAVFFIEQLKTKQKNAKKALKIGISIVYLKIVTVPM